MAHCLGLLVTPHPTPCLPLWRRLHKHTPQYTPMSHAYPAPLPRPQAAMKARDSQRLDAIRFLSAAIKQREIELRETGKEVS